MAKEQTDAEKLEQILNVLGVVRTQQDAMKASHEALGARIGALETADKARKDAEEKGRVEDTEDQARKDAEERERADKARADAGAREQAELPKFIEVQRTVDEIAQAFGDNAGPPRWLNGESLGDYTRRLLQKYKSYSKVWREVDLGQLGDSALGVAAKQIRADAVAAAALPEFQEGRLIERTSRDQYGRTVTKFYGDARVANAPFSYGGLIRRVRLTPVRELLEMRRG